VGFFDKLKRALGGKRAGRTPEELARWLEVPLAELTPWSKGPRAGSEFAYRRFTIPKRRGGERTIDAPGDALKLLQRRVLRRLLNPLRPHPAATGFVRGRSIVDNARPHAERAVVINLDLADFFPGIDRTRVHEMFVAHGWSDDSAAILTSICTHEGTLPQGGPTSPAISNLVCRKLDTRLAALAEACGPTAMPDGRGQGTFRREPGPGGAYTRYADDLTFSFPSWGNRRSGNGPGSDSAPLAVSRAALHVIVEAIREEGFRIQWKKKVRVQRAHQRQTVTGLVVNQQVNLPRATRRRIRAMRHRRRLGQLGAAEQRQLQGWEALQAMVEGQREGQRGSGGAGNFTSQST